MTVALVLHPEGDITELDLPADSLKAMRQAIGTNLTRDRLLGLLKSLADVAEEI